MPSKRDVDGSPGHRGIPAASSHASSLSSRLFRLRSIAGRLRSLRPREWLLLLHIVSLLPLVLVLPHWLPLPRLMQFFDPTPSATNRSHPHPRRLAWMTTAVLRRFLRRDFCMKRSIILFYFLRKWGYAVHVYFGVIKEETALSGHAWVELDGTPLFENGNPQQRYKVTYVYPPESVESAA